MVIGNEDVKELIAEIPEGHKHMRLTIILKDGTALTFNEATIANLVRAYIVVKTHPIVKKVKLKSERLKETKENYAEWQLVEDDT